jgi:hypothetical protein
MGCLGTGFGGSVDDLLDPLWVKKKKEKDPQDSSSWMEMAINSLNTHIKRKTR